MKPHNHRGHKSETKRSRRHHNTDGRAGIKSGKFTRELEIVAKKLNISFKARS